MIPTFKIRCSAIGEIMGGVNRPTAIQLARIDELQKKKASKPLTELQEKELTTLIAKRDTPPELSAGAKTYCQKWVKEKIYGRRKEFSNKYTEKGVQCEDSAIELLSEMMGYGMISKNEQFYEDDDIIGAPDLVLAEIIEEIKNSWDCFTFPLFENVIPTSDYPLQVQGYMAIAKKPKAAVNYCLIDAPEELIDREARNVSFRAGLPEVDMDLYDEVREKMTYDGIDKKLRFKRFEFDRDEQIIATIRAQVALCREYIATIWPVGIEQLSKLNQAA